MWVKRHPAARGRATAPRALHTAGHTVLSAKERVPTPYSASGERRKEPCGGRLARSPGKERIPEDGRVFNIVGGVSLAGFFSCPLFGVSLVRKTFFFFQGWNIITHPPGIFFSHPQVFWFSGRTSDSVPTGQWFEPRLPSIFFFFFFMGFSFSFLFFFFFCGTYSFFVVASFVTLSALTSQRQG